MDIKTEIFITHPFGLSTVYVVVGHWVGPFKTHSVICGYSKTLEGAKELEKRAPAMTKKTLRDNLIYV